MCPTEHSSVTQKRAIISVDKISHAHPRCNYNAGYSSRFDSFVDAYIVLSMLLFAETVCCNVCPRDFLNTYVSHALLVFARFVLCNGESFHDICGCR